METFLNLILDNMSVIGYILVIPTVSAHLSPFFKSNKGSKGLRIIKGIIDLLAGNYLKASNDPNLNK